MPKKRIEGSEKGKHANICGETESKWWITIVLVIGVCIGFAHYHYLYTLFENDKHFSHLADFEREMAYRTEMGLYYSYYKTIINAPSFLEGLEAITRDTVTEYGHQINTLNRFNLYPEVILAFFYRPFRAVAKSAGWRVELCWQVNRGDGLRPVESCEGFGNPHYFYVTGVFAVAATVATSIFFLGVILSDSIFGGLLAAASFLFNHGEATRVQWTPPLRESFAFPFLIAHITVLTYIIKNCRSEWKHSLILMPFSIASLLFWQFSQFALFTQLCCVFMGYVLEQIPRSTVIAIIRSHLASFLIAFVLLFGNEMMLTALYFPAIISLLVTISLSNIVGKIQIRPLYILLSSILFGGLTISLKLLIAKQLQIEDDAHIFDILRSKFTSFSNFHTRLYTCSAEFDFIQYATVEKLFQSLLIPLSIVSLGVFVYSYLKYESKNIWKRRSTNGSEDPNFGHILYNVIQLFCYILMAFLIMRLKLFMTPHLCAIVALMANHRIFVSIFGPRFTKTVHIAILGLIFAMLMFRGFVNVQKQLDIRGEYSNPEQEMLFDWIEKNTKKDDVFAGTMPVMANVKLTTLRPIVNHPHYEHVGIRERTLNVYSVFSKKPIQEVHGILKKMGVNYFVFQLMNCSNDERRPECVYRGMWDEHDPTNKHRTSLCDLWILAANSKDQTRIAPFKIVYNKNRNYIVLKV